ncbi:Alpha-aspartyl dipeptidase [Acipenser ruthenus]|uniref:Alpha-aspartyl dipeptidase n=1 Tax=Acipenser ruthenus TaxID=7906 RepID=A0A444V7U8_ACIRT|nr:Alpha-aspartyl dipeptidase [Acipenser ruthenus]
MRKVTRILFIPYALHDRDAYAKTARQKFQCLGGGNTFRLLKTLYDHNLVSEIKKRVLEETREQRIMQYHEEPDTPSVLVSSAAGGWGIRHT